MYFKKALSLMVIIVLCLSLFSGCGEDKQNSTSTTTTTTATEQQNTQTGKTITVVGQNESMGFWQNVKKGAEDAAKKYGYTLDFVGLDDNTENDVKTHISNLEKALKSNSSGIVVAPMGEGYSTVLSKFYDNKIPVVLIDNADEDDVEDLEGNNKNPIVSTVATSYKQAGSLCAEKMFEKVKENIKKSEKNFFIGVIEREDSEADEAKAMGFVEKFTELADADEGTKGKYRIETESIDENGEVLDELITDNVKAVFMTHPSIADEISDIVAADTEEYKEIIFCGFDSGAKQIKWLNDEKGPQFIGGVAQDSYNLGYNAVEQCAFAIEDKDVKSQIEIDGQWYDKTNADKMKQDNIVFEK